MTWLVQLAGNGDLSNAQLESLERRKDHSQKYIDALKQKIAGKEARIAELTAKK